MAYLVGQGFLETRPGIGTVVAAIPDSSRKERAELLGQEIEQLVVEAKRLGVESEEVIAATPSGTASPTSRSAIFLSSHDLAEIESFSSHVGFLEEGRLLFSEEMGVLSGRFREVMPREDFSVAGLGMCSPLRDWNMPVFVGIACRSAMREPPVTRVGVEWSRSPCTEAAPDAQEGVKGTVWVGDDMTDPAEFGISPVWMVPLTFTNLYDVEPGKSGIGQRRFLCAGAPMTFTRYALVRRTESDVTFENLLLPDWRAQPGGTVVLAR